MEPKISKLDRHPKGWGEELWIENNDLYCGKILNFNNGAKFSMHYHVKKDESWAVLSGPFVLKYYNLETGEEKERILVSGDVVRIKPCVPHQLIAKSDSCSILEVSTKHEEEDSYRIKGGDSQG